MEGSKGVVKQDRIKYTLGDLPPEVVTTPPPVANAWGPKSLAPKQPVALGHRYGPLRQQLQWLEFLQAEWEVFNDPEESYVPTHAWASHLVLDNVIPLLERAGYILKMTKRGFLECVLNYMFRHETSYAYRIGGRLTRRSIGAAGNEDDFANALPTPYQCKHCRPFSSDQAEFFHQRKLPVEVWERLQRKLAVEHWSDGEEFAERFWLDLPHIVFAHCDMEKSRATEELVELLRVEVDGGEGGEEGVRRREVDPYLADYYGSKYKETGTSETSGL